MLLPFAVVNPDHCQPLANYGIVGKLPKLKFRVALNRHRAWQMHAALCSFGGNLKGELIPLKLQAQKFVTPKFVPWQGLISLEKPLMLLANKTHFL